MESEQCPQSQDGGSVVFSWREGPGVSEEKKCGGEKVSALWN